MEDELSSLSIRLIEVESRVSQLDLLSELAGLVHGCLGDVFDILQEQEFELPRDIDERLDRIDSIANLIL